MLLHRRDPDEQAYLEQILEHCREVGVSIRTHPVTQMGVKQKTSGLYFSEDKTLHIARKNRMWFEIFIHEYCHLLQDLDKPNGGWFMDPKHTWKWIAFDGWILHQRELRPDRLLDAARTMAAMELDCDRRAFKIVRKHEFATVDPKLFVQRANSYAWSYEAARLTRKWSNRRRPYMVPELRRLMPDELINESELGTLPEGYLELYVRHCIDP